MSKARSGGRHQLSSGPATRDESPYTAFKAQVSGDDEDLQKVRCKAEYGSLLQCTCYGMPFISPRSLGISTRTNTFSWGS